MYRPPKLPHGVRRLFRLPWSRTRLRADMDEEMRTHLGMRIDHLRMLGMSRREAEIEALRRFGDSDEYRAYTQRRVARRSASLSLTEWADAVAQDVRFAARQFERSARSGRLVRLPRRGA